MAKVSHLRYHVNAGAWTCGSVTPIAVHTVAARIGTDPMEVAILGRIGYDLYSEEPHVPLPQVRRFSRYLGGSSANMAVGLSRLGVEVGISGALGTDSLSQFLIDFLTAERVDVSRVKRSPGYLPSLCLTEISPPDHFPQVFYRRDPADAQVELEPADLDYLASGRMFITNGTSLCASPSREST